MRRGMKIPGTHENVAYSDVNIVMVLRDIFEINKPEFHF